MNFSGYSGDIEGASATAAARTNLHNDQRQPRQIMVENFSSKQINDESSCNDGSNTTAKGILPFGSRETTPANATSTDDAKLIEEKGFIYGNPFVEVAKGIIHIYKKK